MVANASLNDLNMITNIVSGYLCLREIGLNFNI